MGTTISRNAAAGAILADAATTLRVARLRGGAFAREAERFLADVLVQAERATHALHEAELARKSAAEVSDLRVREARLAVGAAYDTLWNALGRPAYDTRLRLWFPEAGSSARGPVSTLAVRMRGIAGAIRSEPHPGAPHPRLDRGTCLALADRIDAAAEAVHAAQQARVEPTGHATYYRQLVQAVARGAHVQLAAYKRVLLALGYGQARIHEVIPDRGERRTPVDSPSPQPGRGGSGVTIAPEMPPSPCFYAPDHHPHPGPLPEGEGDRA